MRYPIAQRVDVVHLQTALQQAGVAHTIEWGGEAYGPQAVVIDGEDARVEPAIVAAAASLQNKSTLEAKASDALAANANFLAITGSLSAAQQAAQLRLLTRENSAIIRLLMKRFESTEGT